MISFYFSKKYYCYFEFVKRETFENIIKDRQGNSHIPPAQTNGGGRGHTALSRQTVTRKLLVASTQHPPPNHKLK